tara:strand:- start:87 stop:479 length:393 start_codon:yes stop_codon:yes gene_type:complete
MAYKQKGWTPFTSIPEKKKVGPVADNPKPKKWTGSDEDYQKHWDEVDAYNRKVDIDYSLDKALDRRTPSGLHPFRPKKPKMVKWREYLPKFETLRARPTRTGKWSPQTVKNPPTPNFTVQYPVKTYKEKK